jgi:hypothetical protein
MNKERGQNPVAGDILNLRFFTYNSNNRMDIYSVVKVETWFLNPNAQTEENPDGRQLVDTLTNAAKEDIGEYIVPLTLDDRYIIGDYIDIWYIKFRDDDIVTTQQNKFKVYPDLWYTDTYPIVYDFNFRFQPNRMRRGTKQYLIVQVRPNVRNQSELETYYSNLAIASPMKIYIEQECVECMPDSQDLRMVVDGEPIQYRENCMGYYLLDTTENGLDLKEGIYNVMVEMEFGDCIYLSEKMQLQII